MRKLSYIILGVLIGAFATYYLCPRPVQDVQAEIIKPEGVISVEEAIVLNDNWTRTRQTAVDSAAGKIDHRSTFWSLKDIRDYLDYADAESTKLGYTMDGIRVYLGVYGDDQPEGKAGYTTMFIAPTGEKADSTASMNRTNSNLQGDNSPVPPLNDGGGSGNGYPQ